MNPTARVLVADDDVELARLVADIAHDDGHEVTTVTSAAAALAELERAPFDLLVTDVRMPRESGIELIERVRERDPRVVTIAMTAFGSFDTAVAAMRAGAFDYVVKPFRPDEMALRVRRALEKRSMALELVRLRDAAARRFSIAGIVGTSSAMQAVAAFVKRVARSPATVLVTGPSGSGKELVARALHAESDRRAGPFVAVNCAAIPETLVEAELFGVKKGAFTDASRDRPGLFREAHGGTLLLDEVGELPRSTQAKLLRVLQEREVRAVGGTSSERVDVRVVAATNASLREAVARQAFREDLFYRLAVLEIAVPPLRDRPEDVAPLAAHFVELSASRARRPTPALSAPALKLLVPAMPVILI